MAQIKRMLSDTVKAILSLLWNVIVLQIVFDSVDALVQSMCVFKNSFLIYF